MFGFPPTPERQNSEFSLRATSFCHAHLRCLKKKRGDFSPSNYSLTTQKEEGSFRVLSDFLVIQVDVMTWKGLFESESRCGERAVFLTPHRTSSLPCPAYFPSRYLDLLYM